MMMRSLTPILSLIVSVVLFVFFVQPRYVEVQHIRAEIDKHIKAVATYNEFKNKLASKLDIKTSRTAAQNEQLDKLVPEKVDDTKLLVDLETLSQSHNLLFGNIDVSKSDIGLKQSSNNSGNTGAVNLESNNLSTVDISFDVIGTYDQFKQFILDLERSNTLFEVVELSFDSSDTPYQQFSLTVRVYTLPKM